MTFHDRVNALCAERGISITKLASELGFSSSTPNNWRDMAGLPRAKTVKAVADYFGVSVDYLLGRTTDNEIKKEAPPAMAEGEAEVSFSFPAGDEAAFDAGFDAAVREIVRQELSRRGIE